MRFRHLIVLLGPVALAAARVLPHNASAVGSVDHDVQTAVEYRPDNIASDQWWDKYRKKGAHYQCLFVADDEDAGRLVEDTRVPPSAQSVWKGDMSAERTTWAWFENYYDEDMCNYESQYIKDAFDALNVNAYCVDDEQRTGHNQGWSLGHYDLDDIEDEDPGQQTYNAEGRQYKCTGAFYTFTVNQIDGVIMALDIYSPHNAVKEYWRGIAKPEDPPKLRYASDLMWGKWVENNANIKNLRVYGAYNVMNDETSGLVSRAMRNKGVANLAIWPGTVFEMEKDGDDFQALIGSPIGGTISIMLAQHKAELGNKEIFQVNVITDEWSLKDGIKMTLHMFFQIRDVPPSPMEDQPEETPEETPAATPAGSKTV